MQPKSYSKRISERNFSTALAALNINKGGLIQIGPSIFVEMSRGDVTRIVYSPKGDKSSALFYSNLAACPPYIRGRVSGFLKSA